MPEFLATLRALGVLDFVNAGATLALTFFAFVQLRQLADQRRRELNAAYGALLVEFWRTWAVSERWRRDDITDDAVERALRPDDILPAEWGALVPLLGALGTQTARFAGMAYAHAEIAAGHARMLMRFAAEREQLLERAPPSSEREQLLTEMATKLDEIAALTRRFANETACILEDALKSAPKWLQKECLDLDGLNSPPAEFMRQQLSNGETP